MDVAFKVVAAAAAFFLTSFNFINFLSYIFAMDDLVLTQVWECKHY